MRLGVAILTVAALAGPAGAVGLDWHAAGGELFAGRPAVAVATDRDQPAHDDVQLPVLVQPYASEIELVAARYRLDSKLLHALVIVESAYRPRAMSPVGAAGLTQLMPATAAGEGVSDRYDVMQSLSGGAAYLTRMLIRFGDLRLALAAYNAGPGRVERAGAVPPIAETRAYVSSVVDCYLALSAARSVRSSASCSAPPGARPRAGLP